MSSPEGEHKMFRALTKSADSEKVLEFLKLAGAKYLKKIEAQEESLTFFYTTLTFNSLFTLISHLFIPAN